MRLHTARRSARSAVSNQLSVACLLVWPMMPAARRPVKATPPARKVGAGAVLVRQWGGVDHEVTVLEKGVLFREKRHRSLSEVARVITGSRWSGPLFFGLKAQAKEVSANAAC